MDKLIYLLVLVAIAIPCAMFVGACLRRMNETPEEVVKRGEPTEEADNYRKAGWL